MELLVVVLLVLLLVLEEGLAFVSVVRPFPWTVVGPFVVGVVLLLLSCFVVVGLMLLS